MTSRIECLEAEVKLSFMKGFAAGRKDAEDNMVGGSARIRLAKLLLRKPEVLRMTHQVVAEMLGCSRETVTRVLIEFKRKKWLIGTHITHRAALEELVANGYMPYTGD